MRKGVDRIYGRPPVSLARAVEAIVVAAVIDAAFTVWALGRLIARRPVPEGILWRRRP